MLHAKHIFDWDSLYAGQYFFWAAMPPTFTWNIATIFPNTSLPAATAAFAPFLDDIRSLGITPVTSVTFPANINELVGALTTDSGGTEVILGSRLWPEETYKTKITAIGEAYKELFDTGIIGYAQDL